MSEDVIRVGYQAFWDPAGDQKVLKAVQDLANQIDGLLKNAVNFSKTLTAIDRLAASFDKIAARADKIQAAVKKATEANKNEQKSAEELLKAYRELDAMASKPRKDSTLYDVNKIIKFREEAKKLAEQMDTMGGDFGGLNLRDEYNKQVQMLREARDEYKRLEQDQDAYNKKAELRNSLVAKYRDEIRKVSEELKRWSKAEYGEAGIEMQIKQLQRLKVIRQEQAMAGVLGESEYARAIKNINARIRELTEVQKAEGKVAREVSDTKRSARKAELFELQRLAQEQEKLQTRIGKLGDSKADIELRSKLEAELKKIILDRIRLQDDDIVSLRKQYEELTKAKVTVEDLAAAYRALDQATQKPRTGNLLADLKREIDLRQAAIKELEKMQKMGAGTVAGVDVSAEMQKQLVAVDALRSQRAEETKIILANLEAEKRKTKEIDEQRAKYAALNQQIAKANEMGGLGGMSLERESLREMQALLTKMEKSGAITAAEYTKAYEQVELAIARVIQAEKEAKAAMIDGSMGASLNAKKEAEELNKLQREYAELEAVKRKLSNTDEDSIQKSRILGRQMDNLNQQMRLQKGDISDLQAANKKLSAEYARVGQQANNALKRLGKSFKDLLRYQLEWYSGTVLILGSTFALSNAIRKAFDFTQEIRDAAAIVNATSKAFEEMKTAAMEVGLKTAVSANDAAEALKVLGQAGLDARGSIMALNTVAMVMVGTGAGVEEAVKSITTAMNVWQVEAEKSLDVGNTMAAMLNYSKLEVQDLGTVFNYLASTAKQVGFSLEETGAAISVLSNFGVKASTIGTGLSNVISSLIAPTDRLRGVLEEFGLSVDEVNPLLVDFYDIIDRIRASGMGVSDIYRAFNKREARIMASAVNAGSEAFREMEKRITGTNALLKINQEVLEGARNQFKLLGNQIQNSFNKGLSESEPVLAAIAKSLRFFMAGIEDGGPALWALEAGFAALAVQILRTGAATKALGAIWSVMGGWWGVLIAGAIAAVSALDKLYKTHEQQIKVLDEENESYLVATERIRQQMAVMDDFQKSLDAAAGNQRDLRSIRLDLINQYPEMIDYIGEEGSAVGDAADEYNRLTDAINRLKEAKLGDMEKLLTGVLANIARQVDEARSRMDDLRDEQDHGWQLGGGKLYTPVWNFSEIVRKDNVEFIAEMSKWEQKLDEILNGASEKIKKFVQAGLSPDEVRRQIREMFSEEDARIVLDIFDEIIEGMRAKTGEVRQMTFKEYQENIDSLAKYYDDVRKQIEGYFKDIENQISSLDLTPEDEHGRLTSALNRQFELIKGSYEREYKEKLAYIDKVDMSERERAAERVRLEEEKNVKIRELSVALAGEINKALSSAVAQLKTDYDAVINQLQLKLDEFGKAFNVDLADTGAWQKTVEQIRSAGDEILQQEEERIRKQMQLVEDSNLKESDAAREKLNLETELAKTKLKVDEEVYSQIESVTKEHIDRLKAQYDGSLDYFKEILKGIAGANIPALDKYEMLASTLKQYQDARMQSLNALHDAEKAHIIATERDEQVKADRLLEIDRKLAADKEGVLEDTNRAIMDANAKLKEDYELIISGIRDKLNDLGKAFNENLADTGTWQETVQEIRAAGEEIVKSEQARINKQKDLLKDANLTAAELEKENTKLTIEESNVRLQVHEEVQEKIQAVTERHLEQMKDQYEQTLAYFDSAIEGVRNAKIPETERYDAVEKVFRQYEERRIQALDAEEAERKKAAAAVEKDAYELNRKILAIEKDFATQREAVHKETDQEIIKANQAVMEDYDNRLRALRGQFEKFGEAFNVALKDNATWRQTVEDIRKSGQDILAVEEEKAKQRLKALDDVRMTDAERERERTKLISDQADLRLSITKEMASKIETVTDEHMRRIRASAEGSLDYFQNIIKGIESAKLPSVEKYDALSKILDRYKELRIKQAEELAESDRESLMIREKDGEVLSEKLATLERDLAEKRKQIVNETNQALSEANDKYLKEIEDQYNRTETQITDGHIRNRDIIEAGTDREPVKYASLVKEAAAYHQQMLKQIKDRYDDERTLAEKHYKDIEKRQKRITELSIEQKKEERDEQGRYQSELDNDLSNSLSNISSKYQMMAKAIDLSYRDINKTIDDSSKNAAQKHRESLQAAVAASKSRLKLVKDETMDELAMLEERYGKEFVHTQKFEEMMLDAGKKTRDAHEQLQSELESITQESLGRLDNMYDISLKRITMKFEAMIDGIPYDSLAPEEELDAMVAIHEKKTAEVLEIYRNWANAKLQVVSDASLKEEDREKAVYDIVSTYTDKKRQAYDSLRKAIEQSTNETADYIENRYDLLLSQIKSQIEAAKAGIAASPGEIPTYSDAIELSKERARELLAVYQSLAEKELEFASKYARNQGELDRQTTKVLVDFAKKKQEVLNELNSSIKDLIGDSIEDIDSLYKKKIDLAYKEIESFDETLQRFHERREIERDLTLESEQEVLDILDRAYGEASAAQIKSQQEIIAVYRDKTGTILDLLRQEYTEKQKQLKQLGTEEEYLKESKGLYQDFVDSQIGLYEKLGDKIESVYENADKSLQEHLDKIQDINDTEKDLVQSLSDARNKLFGIEEGKVDVFDWFKRARETMEAGIASTPADLDRQLADLKKLIEMLENVNPDQAKEFQYLLDARIKEVEDRIRQVSEAARKLEEQDASSDASIMENARKQMEQVKAEIQKLLQEQFDINLVPKFEKKLVEEELAKVEVKVPVDVDSQGLKEKIDSIKNDVGRIEFPTDLDVSSMNADEIVRKIKQRIGPVEIPAKLDLTKLKNDASGAVDVDVNVGVDTEEVEKTKSDLSAPTQSVHTIIPDADEIMRVIAEIQKPTFSTHTIYVKRVSAGGTGGESAEGFNTGGWLPGFGGGDKIHILAELGEYIIRKEAVRYYGKQIFDMINSMQLPRNAPKFATGGPVGPAAMAANSRNPDIFIARIQIGEEDYPLEIKNKSRESFELFVDRLGREKLMRRRR